MRRPVLALLALLAAVGAAATLPLHASAHALRQSSVPDANANLQQAPPNVTITFNEAPDPRLSSITVVSATNGQSYQNGPTMQVPGNPLELEVALKSLPMGVYTVNWRTFSSVDGHIAGGAFAFGVRQDPTSVKPPQQSVFSPPGPSALDIAARSILFIGLVGLVGGAGIATMVLPRPGRAVLRILPVSWAIAVAGVVLVTISQAHNAGVGPGEIFHSSIGHSVLERGVPLVVAGLLLPFCFSGGIARRRPIVGVTGLAGAAAMLGDVLNSHAAAGSDDAINVALQWVHIAAGAIWLGGLLALLIGIRELTGEPRGTAVRRFSTLAGIALVLVAVTGTIRAWVEVGAWDRIWGDAFGYLVIVKASLIVALALLGAVNRFVNVQKAPRVVTGLRRVGSTEVLVALSALVVAGALVNQEPPANQPASVAAAVKQVVLNANDYGTSVKMRLTITPGTTGPDLYTGVITDYDTGKPLSATGVQLGFTAPSCSSLGPTTLVLKNSGPGTWSATGSNLAVGTSWQVTALVNRGAGSVEIPFTVTPTEPAQTLKVTPGGNGLPTLYNITLPVGSLQIYIDPEKAGAVEFHTTYFDANGNGLSTAVVNSVTEGGQSLPTRQLAPGHYVSDATVKAGANTFKISAISGCQALNSTITINVKG